MRTIEVATGRPYRVHVGRMLLEQTGAIAREAAGGGRAAIITDSNVGPLYGACVRGSLEQAGYRVCRYTFPAGEEHKRAETYLAMLSFLAENELGRTDVVIALGGGVTGDLAGFAAATYLRGIPFIQVPTSLLAMVDSSVGGKTGMDLAQGKNLAGAFWQPSAVVADIGCLATLTPAQFADGCGEVIKHAVIADPDLFEGLEVTPLTFELLLARPDVVEAVVARNIEIKRDVVQADERERGMRKMLNFGHSIGHAIEAASGYALGHGTCVAAGMRWIARAAAAEGWCDATVPARIDAVTRAHGLIDNGHAGLDELFHAALHDKKRTGDAIDLIVPEAIGSVACARTPLPAFRALIAEGAPDTCAPRPHESEPRL